MGSRVWALSSTELAVRTDALLARVYVLLKRFLVIDFFLIVVAGLER